MAAPVNDNRADAIELPPDSAVSGTTREATLEPGEWLTYDPNNEVSADLILPYTVWYKHAPTGGAFTLNAMLAFDSAYPVYIALYVDTPEFGFVSASQTLYPVDASTPFSIDFGGGWPLGWVLYVQVAGLSPDYGGSDDTDFQVAIASSHDIALLADVATGSRVDVSMEGDNNFAVDVSTFSSVVADASKNQFQMEASVTAGSSTLTATLWLNANKRVGSFLGDPTAPPGGAVGGADLSGGLGNSYATSAAVTAFEYIGDPADPAMFDEYVSLEMVDDHTTGGQRGYLVAPPRLDGTDSIYTYERWMRVRFLAPFNSLSGLRLWSLTNPALFAAGWSIKWGTSTTYAPPTSAPSAIATADLPVADPGLNAPNLMAPGFVDGSVDRFSFYIVVQASVDPTAADAGPLLGYTPEGTFAVPLELQLAWVET